MKVVLINSWYKQYSTGKLVYAFREFLRNEGHSTLTFYGQGNHVEDEDVYKTVTSTGLYVHGALARLTGFQGCFSNLATQRVISRIEKFSPDVVYIFNLHAYYINEFKLLSYLKTTNFRTVYMLFDEYPYLGKCCFAGDCNKFTTLCDCCPRVKEYPKSFWFDRSKYFYLRKNSIYSGWDNLTFAGVEFLHQQAMLSRITKNSVFVTIDMGVELLKTYYPRESEELRKSLNIPKDHKIVITVGPTSDTRKGIEKFFEIAKLCKDEKVTFINVGFDGEKKDLPSNCIGIKYVSNQDELAVYYSMADLYVITSSGEAMSLTCMEALGCGTKLMGFNISGTPFATSEEFGTFIKYNDLNAFAKAIKLSEIKTDTSVKACRNYALSRYQVSDFVRNLAIIGGVNKKLEVD